MEPRPKPWTFKPETRIDVLNTKTRYEVLSGVLAGKPLKQIARERGVRPNSLSSLLTYVTTQAGSASFEEFVVDLVLSQSDPSLFIRAHRPPTSENLFFRHAGLLQRDAAEGTRKRKAEFLSDARVKQLYEYADSRSHMEEIAGDVPQENFIDRWRILEEFFTTGGGKGFITQQEGLFLHFYSRGKSVDGVARRLNISLSRAQKLGSQIAFKLGISTGKLVSLQCWLESLALGIVRTRTHTDHMGPLISFPEKTPTA